MIDPTTADYARITNNAPAPQIPVHPGPNVPVGATQITAYQNEENYKRQLQAYNNYKMAQKHIKDLILSLVPEPFIAVLADPDVGFANVTIRTIFDHLMTTYGTVTREDLDRNEDELKAPWTPTTPIETLWLQASKAQQFPPATDALSDNYILRALINNIHNTGSFETTLKKYDELPAAEQTLARFKLEMNKSYKSWIKDNNNQTAATAGYGSALAAQAPTPAPSSLTKYSFKVNDTLFAYCYTHGLSIVKPNATEHNSMTCRDKDPGHNVEATLTN